MSTSLYRFYEIIHEVNGLTSPVEIRRKELERLIDRHFRDMNGTSGLTTQEAKACRVFMDEVFVDEDQ